jgi:hypothetical protein
MLMLKERRPAIRTLPGWAISVLEKAGAIRQPVQSIDPGLSLQRDPEFDGAASDPR